MNWLLLEEEKCQFLYLGQICDRRDGFSSSSEDIPAVNKQLCHHLKIFLVIPDVRILWVFPNSAS